MSIATAEQPPQRDGLEEGAIAQLRLHARAAVAQVHQRQWTEDHERGGAAAGGGDETQGEEHASVGAHGYNSALPGARGSGNEYSTLVREHMDPERHTDVRGKR